MARSTIKVTPVPSRYADEKIVHFGSPNGGGLISFRLTNDEKLAIEVYGTDATVTVTHAPDNYDPAQSGVM
jgi:hypothetical protein